MAINSKNAILYNYDTDEVLYSKNPNQKVSIASMTKIMTCIVVLERVNNLDEKVLDDLPVLNVKERQLRNIFRGLEQKGITERYSEIKNEMHLFIDFDFFIFCDLSFFEFFLLNFFLLI